MQDAPHFWTNRSVLGFAGDSDPIHASSEYARQVAFRAIDEGWEGPPCDPFDLAERLSLDVIPKGDLPDARIVPAGAKRARIEFNPNRPAGRLRFSLAHEIAHTFFPDCLDEIRHRSRRNTPVADNWQLELLCNVAAAELIMPAGTLDEMRNQSLSVDRLMDLRKQYDVSTEAMFLRAVRLTNQPCAVFSSARTQDEPDSEFRIDYVVPSRSWKPRLASGSQIHSSTTLQQCTAVGYTAKGIEQWGAGTSRAHIECVGIPPYPGLRYPRIVGFLRPDSMTHTKPNGIVFLRGDATEPRGDGSKIIAHIVNDRTPNWGGRGFAVAVRRKWDMVQDDFQHWASSRDRLALGNSHFSPVTKSLGVFHMVAQHGYGASPRPRIRYAALRKCLEELADIAGKARASVHMPRIGTGEARGNWQVIQELLDETLISQGLDVTVYDLPSADAPMAEQLVLGLHG